MRLVCVKLLQRWVKIFTARQHAYAWISRYCLPILSVCPSVRPSVCLSNAGTASRWIDVSSYFSTAGRIHHCSFLSPTAFHRHAQLSRDGLRRPQNFCGNCVRQNGLNWSDEMWYVDTRGTRACYWADTLTLMNQGSRATTSLKMWDLRRLNLVWYHMRRSSVFLVQRQRRPGHKMAEPGVRKMFLDPTYAKTVWPRKTKLGTITHVATVAPWLNGVRPQCPQHFWTSNMRAHSVKDST